MRGQQWRHHSFKGKKWEQIQASERQQYHLNAYRVLLTRARQGMIIFVPPGDAADPVLTACPGDMPNQGGPLTSVGGPLCVLLLGGLARSRRATPNRLSELL
jgi:hypothetical protein